MSLSMDQIFKDEMGSSLDERVSRLLSSVKVIRESCEQEIQEFQNEIKDLKKHLEDRHKYFEELLNLQMMKPADFLKQKNGTVDPTSDKISNMDNDIQSSTNENRNGINCNAGMTPESPVLMSRIYLLNLDDNNTDTCPLPMCPKSPTLLSSVKHRKHASSKPNTLCVQDSTRFLKRNVGATPLTPELTCNFNEKKLDPTYLSAFVKPSFQTPQSPVLSKARIEETTSITNDQHYSDVYMCEDKVQKRLFYH